MSDASNTLTFSGHPLAEELSSLFKRAADSFFTTHNVGPQERCQIFADSLLIGLGIPQSSDSNEIKIVLVTREADAPATAESSTTFQLPLEPRNATEPLSHVSSSDGLIQVNTTTSATGEGVHTRWIYTDDPLEGASPRAIDTDSVGIYLRSPTEVEFSNDGATLVGSSDDEDKKDRAKHTDLSVKQKLPREKLEIKVSPQKRARDTECSDNSVNEGGPARRTRARIAAGSSISTYNGTRQGYHRDSYAPPPPIYPSVAAPSVSPIPEPPFNHFPKLPRHRPRALRREHAFYHRSHYELAWVPEFGDYDSPPMTVEEATTVPRDWPNLNPTSHPIPSTQPAILGSTSVVPPVAPSGASTPAQSSALHAASVPPQASTSASVPIPSVASTSASPTSGSSRNTRYRKRSRVIEVDEGNNEESRDEERPRRRSRH